MIRRIKNVSTGKTLFLRASVLVLLSLLCFLSTADPVRDFDFWWHLETGEWIWMNKQIPDKDPFTYTFISESEGRPSRAEMILRSYWLSQLVFYGVYTHLGFTGIIFFRSAIFTLILIMLYIRLIRNRVSITLSLFSSFGFVVMAQEFINTRPKMFSFLFFLIVFTIMESYSQKSDQTSGADTGDVKPKTIIWLPLVMVLWANMHGGYLLGIAFLMLYLLTAFISSARSHNYNRIEWKYIIPVCIFSILISFVNPNSYHTLVEFIRFHGSGIRSEGFEEQPPFMMVSHLSINWLVYIILLVVSVFTIAARFKMRAEHTVALIGTAFLSLVAMRYAVYFVMIAASIVPVILSNVFDRVVHKKHQIVLTFTGILLILLMAYKSPNLSEQTRHGYDKNVFPERAVQFIQENALSGKMFNDVTWGGYITFKLHPAQKVFVDTRRLNPEIYNQYLSVINANSSPVLGRPMWKAVLDSYGINYLIHSPVNPYTGKVFPFMRNLENDREWTLLYRDGIAVVFARKGTLPDQTQSGLQTGNN